MRHGLKYLLAFAAFTVFLVAPFIFIRSSPAETPLSISVQNLQLSKVLLLLETKTKVSISSRLTEDPLVSIEVRDLKLGDAVNLIARQIHAEAVWRNKRTVELIPAERRDKDSGGGGGDLLT